MGWALLAHIGIPLLFGIAFLGFSAAATRGPMTWDLAIETGLDLAILSIGATGALFENPKLLAAFGDQNVLVGIGVVAVNLVLSSFLVLLKRRAATVSIGPLIGFLAVFIGLGTIGIEASVVSYGYRSVVPNGVVLNQNK